MFKSGRRLLVPLIAYSAMAICAATLGDVTRDTNLILNGGFESGDGSVPQDWVSNHWDFVRTAQSVAGSIHLTSGLEIVGSEAPKWTW